MFDTDKYAEKYDAAAQRLLGDEPVLAAVQATRTGGVLMLASTAVAGIATIAALVRSKQKAGGLPQMFFLAVTPERLYALGCGRGMNPKATKVIASWERGDLRFETDSVVNGTKITFHTADGETFEVQGPKGELTDRVVRALALEAVAA